MHHRSVPLDLDGLAGDIGPFQALDARAGTARVAFIGEMDHFIREKYDFRLMCIRYLSRHGYRWFGEEIPADRGERYDRFLKTGDEHWLDPIDERPWFTTGVLAKTPQPSHALDRAQRRFMIDLRRVVPNARWFGFDADSSDRDYLTMANDAQTFEQLRPAMAERERIMHARVAEKLHDEPQRRIALLGAVLHLVKNDDAVDAPGVGAGPGGGYVPSLGHHVTNDLVDGEVLAVWLLHGTGRSANPWLEPPGEVTPRRGTFDASLVRRYPSPRFFFVGDDRKRRSVTQMHNLVLTCRFADQVDGIVFAPNVTPL